MSDNTKGPFELVNNADSKNSVYKIDVVEKQPVLDKTKTNYFLMRLEKAKEMGFLHCEVEDE